MTLRLLDQLLLFRHALFSIPWLLISVLFFSATYPIKPQGFIFWMAAVGAFIGGRSLGMALNRLADAEIDRRNPRTKGRPLPSGQISRKRVLIVALFSLTLFLASVFVGGKKLLLFSIIPLTLIVSYSWTKRWTPFCHFWLGGIYFFIPPLISFALFGKFYTVSWALGGVSALLMSAGDLLYAIQDVDFDRREGLKSFPATFGVNFTIWTARFLVFMALAFLALLGLWGGALFLALLWGRYLLSRRIRESEFAAHAFQTCNLFGGFLLLFSCLLF